MATDYGLMHATSEAVLVAKRIYFQHLRRYSKYGDGLLSSIIPDGQTHSPLEDYVAECVVRYDFIHSEDEDYPGIDTVCLCFMHAFECVYVLPLGE